MMWMPLRAPKMKVFIFGFQRLVWWLKWTPASIISRIEMGASGEDCSDGAPLDGGMPPDGGPPPGGDPEVVSVVVCMCWFFPCVGFRRQRHRRPQPRPRFHGRGTHGRLGRRVVSKRVRFLPRFRH